MVHSAQQLIQHCLEKMDLPNEELCKYKSVFILYCTFKSVWYGTTSLCEFCM